MSIRYRIVRRRFPLLLIAFNSFGMIYVVWKFDNLISVGEFAVDWLDMMIGRKICKCDIIVNYIYWMSKFPSVVIIGMFEHIECIWNV